MNTACPACGRTLPVAPLPPPAGADRGREQACLFCSARFELMPFPALGRGLAAGVAAEALLAGSEAGCFTHPEKRAVVACDRCGRFLCGLCDVQIGERHYCPACLSAGRAGLNEGGAGGDRGLPQLDAERMSWDRLALALAIYPALLIWVPIVTAPMVMVLIFRHWRTPVSLVRGGRARFAVAGVLALLELAGLALLVIFTAVAIAAGE